MNLDPLFLTNHKNSFNIDHKPKHKDQKHKASRRKCMRISQPLEMNKKP